MQRTILCYGDSNTWGFVPLADDNKELERFSRSKRWPGVLQNILGENYYVVEEGLNGRTTNINYHIPPDRNGKTYLPSCLYSHAPIDLVVLALGVNDLKVYFKREAIDICDGLAELVDVIQTSQYSECLQTSPKILILPPPMLLPIIEEFVDEDGVAYFHGAVKKAKQLVNLYDSLSKAKNCYFLDISKTITASKIDGLHLDVTAHIKLAEIVCDKIHAIYE